MSRVNIHLDPEPSVLVQEVWSISTAPASWILDRGLNGTSFARLVTTERAYCLRRLPDKTSVQWLSAVHGGVEFLRQHDFQLIPGFLATETGETAARHHGRLYDLAEWAVGDVVGAADLSESRLLGLGEAIGRLHQAGADAPGPPARLDWLPEEVRTSMRLAWVPVPRGRDAWQKLENLEAFFRPLAAPDSSTRLSDDARQIIATASDALEWLQGSDRGVDLAADPPTLTHGDLWLDHARFTGEQVASLIDVDTLALRPPLGDVAALCADFGRWDLERCRAILNGYRRIHPVRADSLRALPGLGARRILGLLRERLRAWLDPNRRGTLEASLGGSVPYWREQLRTLMALNLAEFGRELGIGNRE